MLDKSGIAEALREFGHMLRLKDENQFKVKAYLKASESLEALKDDLGTLIKQKRLTEIDGIGAALAEKITELYTTGRMQALDELRASMPPGLLELSKIQGLGVSKILQLEKELGITSVAALKAACESGQVASVSGFGKKTEQKILEAIEKQNSHGHLMILAGALDTCESLLSFLQKLESVENVAITGEVRRWKELVDHGEIIIASSYLQKVKAELTRFAPLQRIEDGSNPSQVICIFANGLRITVTFVNASSFAFQLLKETGTSEHIERLEEIATKHKTTLSVIESKSPKSESEIYQSLNLPFIPAELREDEGEFEAIENGDRFEDLIEIDQIIGMTHCHSTYSDGVHSIEKMAKAADEMGMQYMTITDHSQSANYAGGLTVDRLKQQWEEIDKVQEKVKVKLLRGTESDILSNGALDFPDSILEKFEVIIASIHSRMKMDEDEMTSRLKYCMQLPQFKIWGHALGRRLLERDPIKCRVEEILDVIAESKVAIEINGNPHRMDMAPEWARLARKRGIKFVISTDAHSTEDLNYLRYGVHLARRAGIRKQDVLNTLPLKQFKEAVRP
jgi:DNA polymerase (family X)